MSQIGLVLGQPRRPQALHLHAFRELREDVAMADATIARRKFLLGAGVAGTAVAAGIASQAEAQIPVAAPAAAPSNEAVTYLTLSALEAAFLSAVADTMIPADELSPSGTDCGVVIF